MFIGVLSDTHKDRMNALRAIIAEFKKRGVSFIVHCGDIAQDHLNAELFGGIPVVCALTEEQVDRFEFETPPKNWTFTKPGQRIHQLNKYEMIYVGHKLSFEFLTGSEQQLNKKLNEIREKNDGVRWLFSGHTHHQIYKQSHLINFVNPGAVEDSFDGYEFAVINTDNGEIVFGRIPTTNPIKPTFSVGVISDSLKISEMDPGFWEKLRKEFKDRGVEKIIHCGNISINDIGRPELAEFQVFYYLREDQESKKTFENWTPISFANPVVEINGYKFYVQLDLGAELLEKSEVDMHKLCLSLRRKYPEISFVLCGLTSDAFLEEGQQIRIVNPGDVLNDRNFAVICLPRTEITFGHVPVDPLPELQQL